MSTKKAFTLIEILIVVAIIAILTLLAIANWHQQLNRAKDAQRKKDLNRLKIAFEEYYDDNNCYPPTDIVNHCGGNQLQPYLNTIPCDPAYKTPYCYVTDGSNCPQEFKLLATLQNRNDPAIKDLGCNGADACGYETTCHQLTGRTGYNYGVSSSNASLANPNPEPVPSSTPQSSPTPNPTSTPTPSPSSSPTPTPHPGPLHSPTPTPTPTPGNYACDPQGVCNYYADPASANCPVTFANSTCNNACSNPANRCSQ